ncbi:MAG: U32 family peptidase [Kiritimatiellia bacterium]|nr:U32 family peptidase [Kiritimatiellia bacterium]
MNNNPTKGGKNRSIELLAPAGNIAAGYAALHYGADAVYLGLSCFSARAHAINFSIADLAEIAGYAHSLRKRRKIYVAVNTLILQNELSGLIDLLAAIAAVGVDAVIVQDIGVLNILRRYFPQLKAQASTQMAIHNLYGAEAAREMGIRRVTLARELTLAEIAKITAKSGIETEVFIHGALCYSYSGLCLFSSHLYGRSGNRGECAYPCREWFRVGDQVAKQPLTPMKTGMTRPAGGFIFSMKDLALADYIADLKRAGVTALKIEGRMKSPLYVAATVNYYRHLIDGRLSPDKKGELAADVRTVFSRPWTDLYLKTRKNSAVIDNEISGHRGCPAGQVEKIVKSSLGHFLHFRTELPIELHDGLQIDIAGLPRPFGFAVRSIHLIEHRRDGKKNRVFTAPEGASVEIPIPRGHPIIPLGAVIYSSSSQKVKQHYDFFKPKPGQFLFRQRVDFTVQIASDGFDISAVANVLPGIKGKPIRLETKRNFDGLFQQARDINQINAAIEETFRKLGATKLAPGKISIDNRQNFFVPVSVLNAARREISLALEHEIAELPRKYAAEIKIDMAANLNCQSSVTIPAFNSVIPDMSVTNGHGRESRISSEEKLDSRFRGNDRKSGTCKSKEQASEQLNFKWSIKTDQPHLLAAFGPDDWQRLDEIIIECVINAPQDFIDQIKRLSAAVDPARIRLALPLILREWEAETMAQTVATLISMGCRKWQISNLGGWSFLQAVAKSGIQLDISADWPVYAMNSPAVSQLNTLGISKFTLSPEDGLENMRALLKKHASNATVIAYQDTPLMISETCLFASRKCSYPNACGAPWTKLHDEPIFGGTRRSFMRRPGNFRETLFSSPRGDKIRVVNQGCRLVVLNSQPFCLGARLDELAAAGAVLLRMDCMYREYSKEELLDLWRRFRSGAEFSLGHTANFKQGLG